MGAGDRLRVEVLGPLRVVDAEGRDRTPHGELQRRLFALLVLHRGRVVSNDAAVDALWSGGAPQDPQAALQTHVFRLRRGLPAGLIDSVGDGYRLDPTAVEVDADRLVEIIATGSADADAPMAELEAVLGRWTGPAYPELDDVDDGRAAALRLDELRVRAQEVRAQWRLDRGDTDGLVAELTALAGAEPLRERPRQLLMEVLTATGRRVEALRVYDEFRRLLGDELGIEPSPVLAAEHQALLVGELGDAAAPDGAGAAGTWALASRLPAPATSLVGRDEVTDGVVAVAGRHRLVCLVGPGGVGKTQLAVEVGRRLRRVRPERPVVLCELATADTSSAVDVIAAALGIDARPGTPLVERVAAVVGDGEVTVVVDNCEHVLDPVAELIDRLLRSCPNVAIVATSRERLRLPGEQVVVVRPLTVDGDDPPAVVLFVERARAVRPGFSPDAGERAAIAEIVRRLDGLPLAIELAAACLHTHDVVEVAAGLDHRFALLSSGSRVSPRHGSLRAAVGWSYGLLDESLQRVFRALSVFAGSFTADGAAAVCLADPVSTTAALAQLTERSLVQRTADRRYVLLETLRAFGTELLVASGEVDAVGERHARHLVDWVEDADRRLSEPGEQAIADIDAAMPELRVALTWLLAHDDHERAGRLVAALLHYGFLRLRPDVLGFSELVLAADPDDRSRAAPLVWVAAAYCAWMVGDLAGARRCSERARRVAERTSGPPHPKVPTCSGTVALLDGRLDDSVRWYRRAVQISVDDPAHRLFAAASELLPLGYADDPATAERARLVLADVGDVETPQSAYVWYCAGEAVLATDADLARDRLARSIELAERSGAAFVTGAAGASKASLDARAGDPAAAAADYRWLIEHWRRAGIWLTQWTMLRSVAALLDRLGRHRDAAVLLGAVQAPRSGRRAFGADEVALALLGTRLRAALGDEAYERALAEGGALDGDAAVEHARRAL